MPQVRSGSYGHRIVREGRGDFRIYWTIDRKYEGSRLRYPRSHSRDTDEAGARRFAKKHAIPFPETPVGDVAQIATILGMLRSASSEGYGYTPEYIARIWGLDLKIVKAHLRKLKADGIVGNGARGWFKVGA